MGTLGSPLTRSNGRRRDGVLHPCLPSSPPALVTEPHCPGLCSGRRVASVRCVVWCIHSQIPAFQIVDAREAAGTLHTAPDERPRHSDGSDNTMLLWAFAYRLFAHDTRVAISSLPPK